MEFTLPAKVFQAAQIFKAKQDIRFYLEGVYVSDSAVVSTNGHCMYVWEHHVEIQSPVIVSVSGTIPKKSEFIEFDINDENKDRSIGWCLGSDGEVLSVVLVKVIDAEKFPDWRRVLTNDRKPTDEVGINASYLSMLEKAVKLVGNSDFCGAKMVLSGADKSIRFDIKGSEYKSTVIIMPMRL